MKILVTGVTGLGGHLAPHLVAAGHDVVGFSRDPSRAAVDVPLIAGDATRRGELDRAMDGVDVAYFMMHSYEKANGDGFAIRDRLIARNFAAAAREAGVHRVVYFGVPPIDGVHHCSAHVDSRLEVEDILAESTPDSVAIGAFTIVTPRSRSFRVVLNLLAHNVVLPLPPWRRNVTQPMDFRDVSACLTAAASHPGIGGKRLRIGGPQPLSWDDLLRRLATAMNHRGMFAPIPFAVPPVVMRWLATVHGGNPALLGPLLDTITAGSITIADNGARELDVALHPIDGTIAHAVAEYRDGCWRATEGRPREPVEHIGSRRARTACS